MCCVLVPCFTLCHQGGDVYDEDSEDEREEYHAMGPVPAHAKQGAPLKAWDSLGPLQKRRQSQKAFDEMKKAAQIRNVEPERLAGNLLHRFRSLSKVRKFHSVLFLELLIYPTKSWLRQGEELSRES